MGERRGDGLWSPRDTPAGRIVSSIVVSVGIGVGDVGVGDVGVSVGAASASRASGVDGGRDTSVRRCVVVKNAEAGG